MAYHTMQWCTLKTIVLNISTISANILLVYHCKSVVLKIIVLKFSTIKVLNYLTLLVLTECCFSTLKVLF